MQLIKNVLESSKPNSRPVTTKEQNNLMKEYQKAYVQAILKLNNQGVNVSDYTLFDVQKFTKTKKECMLCFNLPDSDAKKTIVAINCILIAMDAIEANMIYYDFFFKTDKNWWVKFYSKSSYYRIRKQSMVHFLKLAGEL